MKFVALRKLPGLIEYMEYFLEKIMLIELAEADFECLCVHYSVIISTFISR